VGGVDQERKGEELQLKKLVKLDAREDPLVAPGACACTTKPN